MTIRRRDQATPGPWRYQLGGRAHWWRPSRVVHERRSRSRALPNTAAPALVDHVGIERFFDLARAVVADRAEQRAVFVRAVASRVEVTVDQFQTHRRRKRDSKR